MAERFAMVLKIKPGKKNDYILAHKNVWPDVLKALKDSNIKNNSAFVSDDLLFMYLEYNGNDFNSDWKKYGENPRVHEWVQMLKNFLEPYEKPAPSTGWTVLQEAFHID